MRDNCFVGGGGKRLTWVGFFSVFLTYFYIKKLLFIFLQLYYLCQLCKDKRAGVYIMIKAIEEGLPHCLYFSTQDLARLLAAYADEAWAPTGLSPSHGYTLFLILHNPGCNMVWLSEQMHLAPSTISRFVDKLEQKGLVKRQQVGRNISLSGTKKGSEMEPLLQKASENIYLKMIDAFGEEEYFSSRDKIVHLTQLIRKKKGKISDSTEN